MNGPTLAGLLADGAWHRGPALAEALGVSRATVSARAAVLREMGLAVYAVAGRGYRLSAPLDLLDADTIARGLSMHVAARLDAIEVIESIDSTNAELARRDDGGLRALFAEHQHAGRGRARRPWASPFAANLYLSLACTLAGARAPLGALSLAVGARLAPALSGLGVADIGLKWPNDLWAGQRKLGGILIEHRGEVGGSARLVVGLGLNVAMQPRQGAAIDQAWTRLADHVAELPSRNVLAARLLEALVEAVSDFEREGFAPFMAAWSRYDVTRNRRVEVLESGDARAGIARGIAADGALQIETGGRLDSVYSGDVSLRLSP